MPSAPYSFFGKMEPCVPKNTECRLSSATVAENKKSARKNQLLTVEVASRVGRYNAGALPEPRSRISVNAGSKVKN